MNAKQTHWHVRGSSFDGVYELLDDVAAHAGKFADAAAGRVVELGSPVDAWLTTITRTVATTTVPAGFSHSGALVAAVVAEIDTVLVDVRAAIDGLGAIDLAGQDVTIGIMRGLEMDRWFMLAYVATD